MMKKCIYIGSILCLLIGCVPKVADNVIGIEVNESQSFNISQYFKEAKPIFLQFREDALVSFIGKIVLAEDRIFIQDNLRNTVHIFDAKGEVVAVLNDRGRGPGETLMLSDISVDKENKELVLLSSTPGKFMYYDFNGVFKKELSCSTYCYSFIADKGIIKGIVSPGDSLKYLKIWQESKDSLMLKASLSVKKLFHYGMTTEGLDLLKGEQINFAIDFDPTIYSWKGQQIVPRYKFDFGKNTFNPLRLKDIAAEDFMFKILRERSIFKITNIKEMDKDIYFSTNLKGIGVVSKATRQAQYYMNIWDDKLNLKFKTMIPVEDAENSYVATAFSMPSLKRLLEKQRANEPTLPQWLVTKIEHSEEDANPLLLLYEVKK